LAIAGSATHFLLGVHEIDIVQVYCKILNMRGYRADSGAAGIVGKRPMIDALRSLKASIQKAHLPDEMAAFGISGTKKRGLAALFATHPDLDDRIRALAESSDPDYTS
jgi:Zn-dependent protease with chaperone function